MLINYSDAVISWGKGSHEITDIWISGKRGKKSNKILVTYSPTRVSMGLCFVIISVRYYLVISVAYWDMIDVLISFSIILLMRTSKVLSKYIYEK